MLAHTPVFGEVPTGLPHHPDGDAFDGFTTTLSVSPHKHTPTLFEVGRGLDPDRFLAIDFKKNDGFTHSLQLSAELGLYRQKYCGCEFSMRRLNKPKEG